MRRLLLVICALFLASSVFGQQIKSREAGFEEFRTLLERTGYNAYSFDLTELLGDRYNITLSVKEYKDGKEVKTTRKSLGSNKRMVTDFPEESRKKITPEQMADPATQTYRQAEKLTIGFYPSGTDTLARLVYDIPTMTTMGDVLTLQGIEQPDAKTLYWYHQRPFIIDSFEPGKFIPLVFYGSGWYDENVGCCRFCGESKIAADLSSEIVEKVPHFYVIGVEFTKK